jgi:hypothetical protein
LEGRLTLPFEKALFDFFLRGAAVSSQHRSKALSPESSSHLSDFLLLFIYLNNMFDDIIMKARKRMHRSHSTNCPRDSYIQRPIKYVTLSFFF